MTLNPFFFSRKPGLFFLRLACLALAGFSLFSLSAAEPLPLPDTVRFKDDAKLPLGIKDTTLPCSIVSEDSNVLVVETSTNPAIIARFSIDKTLIESVNHGDASLRPFAEISPEFVLPPESREPAYYDDKIDRIFRPFLKKYPQSPGAASVRNAEKAFTDEQQRVTNGEFRAGQRWTQKSLLAPIDLLAIKLIDQARQDGVTMSLPDFKKMIEEAKTCFASEFFPVLGKTLEEVSIQRVEKLQKEAAVPDAPKTPTFDDLKKAELEALIPVSGWNWDSLNKAVAMVSEAETMLKNNPPDLVDKPLDLIKQSQALMPFLLARERILRQQAAAYGEKGTAEAKVENREKSLAWWSAALQLPNLLPPPENQTLTNDIFTLFEKSFTTQANISIERREYGDATAWMTDVKTLVENPNLAAPKVGEVNKHLAALKKVIEEQSRQQGIDNFQKKLAEERVQNNFESTRLTLTNKWSEIQKLNPTPEETAAIAHAALDQSMGALKSFHFITGCQLLRLAHDITPEDPRVKTWIFTATMIAIAVFLAMLFPLFWIFARGGMFIENIRYRFRLKKLRKSTPKKGPDFGSKRR